MVKVEVTEELSLSAEAVWKVIGDFTDIRRWAPFVRSSRGERTPQGLVRVIVLPNGGVLRERLISSEPFAFTFSADGGAQDHVSTQRVESIDDGHCRLVLSTEYTPQDGVGEEEAKEAQTRAYRNAIGMIRKALGLN